MARRILDVDRAGLDHPALLGVPATTGHDGAGVDAEAVKILMFVDGESSLRDLAEVLSLDPSSLLSHVVKLFDAGVLTFDEKYVAAWLADTPPEEAPRSRAAPPPSGEDRVRIIATTPPRPTAFPEAPRLSSAPQALHATEGGGDSEQVDPQDGTRGEIVEEGRLEESASWQVFTRLARTDMKGRVRLVTPEGHRDVHLVAGKPVFAITDVPAEDLGSLLRERDRIGEQDFVRYMEARKGSTTDPSRLLVMLGIVPEYNRLRALRWQVQTIVFNALSLTSGTFLVEKLEDLPARSPRFDINFSRILTRFLDEKLPVEKEIEQLQEKIEHFVVAMPGAGAQSFSEKEQRLWEIIQERPRKLKQVLAVSTMFRRETFKFVLLLLVNGLVDLVRHVTLDEGPVDLAMLNDLAEDLESQHFFDVLGLHAVSDRKDIDEVYAKMSRKFDPSSYNRLDAGQKTLLGRCRARVEDAYKTLMDDQKRTEYRRQVFSAYQLAQFAQLQYQKGEIYLWWRHDPVEAFSYFRSSFELDPAQPVYWGGYAISALAGGSLEPAVRRQAVQLAERIAGLKTVDPVALVMAGGALTKAGQAGRGQDCINRALQLGGGTAAIQKMVRVIAEF